MFVYLLVGHGINTEVFYLCVYLNVDRGVVDLLSIVVVDSSTLHYLFADSLVRSL